MDIEAGHHLPGFRSSIIIVFSYLFTNIFVPTHILKIHGFHTAPT